MNCGICMTAILTEDSVKSCSSCDAHYHEECWDENGGCAVYGCSMVPATDKLKPLEIPPAFWGREDKDCPNCGKKIKAMAVRCRYCGARIEAKIEEKAAHKERQERIARAPRLRTYARLFLILSLLPLAAIIPAALGTLFYRRNKEEIRRLPGSYDGYYRISIAISTAQTAIFVIALIALWLKS